jgi:hypothetical protein
MAAIGRPARGGLLAAPRVGKAVQALAPKPTHIKIADQEVFVARAHDFVMIPIADERDLASVR